MYRLPLLLALIVLHPVTRDAISTTGASCKPLPAPELYNTETPNAKTADKAGYQLQEVRWDPLLQRRWAVFIPCNRPELPSKIVPLEVSQRTLKTDAHLAATQVFFPVVHVGDLVHIRKHEAMLQVELTGVADESGPIGSRIRVHILRPADATMTQTSLGRTAMLAVVRGPAEVEMTQ